MEFSPYVNVCFKKYTSITYYWLENIGNLAMPHPNLTTRKQDFTSDIIKMFILQLFLRLKDSVLNLVFFTGDCFLYWTIGVMSLPELIVRNNKFECSSVWLKSAVVCNYHTFKKKIDFVVYECPLGNICSTEHIVHLDGGCLCTCFYMSRNCSAALFSFSATVSTFC